MSGWRISWIPALVFDGREWCVHFDMGCDLGTLAAGASVEVVRGGPRSVPDFTGSEVDEHGDRQFGDVRSESGHAYLERDGPRRATEVADLVVSKVGVGGVGGRGRSSDVHGDDHESRGHRAAAGVVFTDPLPAGLERDECFFRSRGRKRGGHDRSAATSVGYQVGGNGCGHDRCGGEPGSCAGLRCRTRRRLRRGYHRSGSGQQLVDGVPATVATDEADVSVVKTSNGHAGRRRHDQL